MMSHAEVNRLFEALELVWDCHLAERNADKRTQAYATYCRVRRDLIRAADEHQIYSDEIKQRYLDVCGIDCTPDEIAFFVERREMRSRNGEKAYRKVHLLYRGEGEPLGPGHGHAIVIVDQDDAVVRISHRRPAAL